jgi:[acyl-carrier-protein] S-malonyltransferase
VKLAFLFPGQGVDLLPLEPPPETEPLLSLASSFTSIESNRLTPRDLERTDVLQPMLTALTLGIHLHLDRHDIRPHAVAGHSLGEIAAACAAGCFGHEKTVEIAALRGRLMADLATRHPGGMLALLTDDPDPALDLGARHGQVVLAAHNAPREWVVSGNEAALEAISSAFPSVRLAVSGAWHGPYMKDAVDELRAAVEDANPAAPSIPLLLNRNGREEPAADLAEILAGQLMHPVRWQATMQSLAAMQVTDIVTMGPGKVLRGLVRKNLGALPVHSTQHPASLAKTLETLHT